MKKEEPIRIAQIVGKWVGGGVESFLMNYYRKIDKNKIQFDFICDEDSVNIPKEEIELMGGKVIMIPPYQKIFQYHKQLKKVLKDGNYKIVHSHINTLSIFSLFAAKCAKVPVRIAHSHATTNKKEFKRNLIKNFLKLFSRLFATDFFACSSVAGEWLFGKKTNFKIIYNAIDSDKFKFNEKTRENLRKKLNIPKDAVLIGHIGRFVETKNQEFLIDLFDRFKNDDKYYLILIGDGPDFDSIQDTVKNKGLKNVIILHQQKNIMDYYSAIDVFTLPSLYEGLGLVLVEAQTSGCYCVASDRVPTEVKMNDNFIFLNLESGVDYWYNHIKDLDLNYDRNLNNVRKEYNINYSVKRLEDEYMNFDKCDLISVVIPVYNVELLLKKCIDSVCSQTYSNLEIILVDDGSTDKSGIICDELSKVDDRIVVYHKKNGGLSDARNFGIDRANGELITFIDSDDFVKQDYIEKLYNCLKNNDSDISIGLPICIYEDGTTKKMYRTFPHKIQVKDSIEMLEIMLYQKRFDTNAWCKMYKRNLFSDDIRYPKGRVYEDLGTTYKLFLKAKKIAFTNEELYYYYQRKNSIVRSDFSKRDMDLLKSVEDLENGINNFKFKDEKTKKKITKAFKSRAFSANCYLLRKMKNNNNFSEEYSICKNNLKKYRIFSSKARLKNNIGVIISYINIDFISKI